MPKASATWLIKQCVEFVEKTEENIEMIPGYTRGLYALLHGSGDNFDVVYIGMSAEGGVRKRLKAHLKSQKKKDEWTHFSIYEVHDNIQPKIVAELEGLIRHIFSKDKAANFLAKQKQYEEIVHVSSDLDKWLVSWKCKNCLETALSNGRPDGSDCTKASKHSWERV